MIKNFVEQKSLVPEIFTGKDNLFLKKIESKIIFLTELYKVSVTIIPKSDSEIIRKQTYG